MPGGLPRIVPLADDAWCIELGDAIDGATLGRVHALAARLGAGGPDGVLDIVPAHASLGVFFDLDRTTPAAVRAWLLSRLRDDMPADVPPEVRQVDIPVCYGGEHGPDLDAAARELGLSSDELARRHASGDYTVAMIGFAPGFPYLVGLDPALALPRLATPRTHVPAGAVAIGGMQTGIYPRESPGGWRILGRTPRALFDASRSPPALLQPGDRVRFVPIEAALFDTRGEHAA